MKIFRFLPIAFAIVLGLSSCGDENSAIGSSIVDTNIEIVVDSSFQELITVESVPNDSVVGRTITQLIGRISIPGYGRLETDFLTLNAGCKCTAGKHRTTVHKNCAKTTVRSFAASFHAETALFS